MFKREYSVDSKVTKRLSSLRMRTKRCRYYSQKVVPGEEGQEKIAINHWVTEHEVDPSGGSFGSQKPGGWVSGSRG